jgi:Cdc6-like AAA superfamily ATPase
MTGPGNHDLDEPENIQGDRPRDLADVDVAAFARSYAAFTQAMYAAADGLGQGLNQLGQAVRDFLGVDLATVDTVREEYAPHEVVDLDRALSELAEEYGAARHGIRGPGHAEFESLEEFFENHTPFSLGAPSYHRTAVGPEATALVVAQGLTMAMVDGTPVVWFQRGPNPRYGRDAYTLEVMSAEPSVVEMLLSRVRTRMASNSVLRGQVLSFARNAFDARGGGALTFLPRPVLPAEQVILPEGLLERIRRHVIGIGEQRDLLRRAGQHLKRGVLLYGPPGTGKTHIIRHLISSTPGVTVVLLSGQTLELLHHAAKLARAAQPAIVVLEDCDLVAEHRGGTTNAALFETLEAMDGLDGDADVTFVLTTNRVDLLERALAERPGRVDLAVAVEKPDLNGRRRLFGLYGADLLAAGEISEETLDQVATRTEGVTASFAKELIRRTVLQAAAANRTPSDTDLLAATEEMLSDTEALTRTLLGAGTPLSAVPDLEEDDLVNGILGAQPGVAPRGNHT